MTIVVKYVRQYDENRNIESIDRVIVHFYLEFSKYVYVIFLWNVCY